MRASSRPARFSISRGSYTWYYLTNILGSKKDTEGLGSGIELYTAICCVQPIFGFGTNRGKGFVSRFLVLSAC